jgi:hypothetical protein
MVCKKQKKNSHFCIGQAQSILCAAMQLMTAVGHCHVRPTPTKTWLVNPPIEQDVGYHLDPFKKRWFSCQQNQPFEEDFSYHLGCLSVTVLALVPSKVPFSDPPISCGTPF